MLPLQCRFARSDLDRWSGSAPWTLRSTTAACPRLRSLPTCGRSFQRRCRLTCGSRATSALWPAAISPTQLRLNISVLVIQSWWDPTVQIAHFELKWRTITSFFCCEYVRLANGLVYPRTFETKWLTIKANSFAMETVRLRPLVINSLCRHRPVFWNKMTGQSVSSFVINYESKDSFWYIFFDGRRHVETKWRTIKLKLYLWIRKVYKEIVNFHYLSLVHILWLRWCNTQLVCNAMNLPYGH